MSIALRFSGRPHLLNERPVLKVTRAEVAPDDRKLYAIIVPADVLGRGSGPSLDGYSAVLTEEVLDSRTLAAIPAPVIDSYGRGQLSGLSDGYIVSISPKTGGTRVLYRPDSGHNSFLVTERCNSNCLMCSQPPRDRQDGYLIDEHVKAVSLIEDSPLAIGITGGEPTLLGDDLFRLLAELKTHLPLTHVHMLTNGRLFASAEFVKTLADVGHPNLTLGIPLYSDVAMEHDFIVQARGAFDQTVHGLYNAASQQLDIEIRVVLHKLSVPRLPNLAEFIYRNFPFISHVALMGLENMGYVKKNWDLLWVDPIDYVGSLKNAVTLLHQRRMRVSLYNLQLCVLPRQLWPFARQSISDYKHTYLEDCGACFMQDECCGLFDSSVNKHSVGIEPIAFPDAASWAR